jgi:hypothetical protein
MTSVAAASATTSATCGEQAPGGVGVAVEGFAPPLGCPAGVETAVVERPGDSGLDAVAGVGGDHLAQCAAVHGVADLRPGGGGQIQHERVSLLRRWELGPCAAVGGWADGDGVPVLAHVCSTVECASSRSRPARSRNRPRSSTLAGPEPASFALQPQAGVEDVEAVAFDPKRHLSGDHTCNHDPSVDQCQGSLGRL